MYSWLSTGFSEGFMGAVAVTCSILLGVRAREFYRQGNQRKALYLVVKICFLIISLVGILVVKDLKVFLLSPFLDSLYILTAVITLWREPAYSARNS